LARLGTGGGQHVNITVLCLAHGAGSGASSRPDAGQRPLLTESRFVFVEDLQAGSGVLRLNFCELRAEVFLKSSCAATSGLGMLWPWN
jgi:hypothetical protein